MDNNIAEIDDAVIIKIGAAAGESGSEDSDCDNSQEDVDIVKNDAVANDGNTNQPIKLTRAERKKITSAAWRANNRGKCAAYAAKARYKDGKEVTHAKQKANREKNKEKINKRQNEWYKKNKETEQYKPALPMDKQTFETVFTVLQGRCAVYDRKSKRKSENPVTANDLKHLYDKQQGRCTYTKVELSLISRQYQISVDRINSDIGHTVDNCQLVILPINYMKSDISHANFLQLLENIRNTTGEIAPTAQYDALTTIAKDKIRYMIKNIQRRSKDSGKACEITLNIFKEWRQKYGDICQITNCPINWETHQWNTGSIDRIDSSRGYTLDNIQFVIWPINMMKNNMTNDEAKQIIDLIL